MAKKKTQALSKDARRIAAAVAELHHLGVDVATLLDVMVFEEHRVEALGSGAKGLSRAMALAADKAWFFPVFAPRILMWILRVRTEIFGRAAEEAGADPRLASHSTEALRDQLKRYASFVRFSGPRRGRPVSPLKKYFDDEIAQKVAECRKLLQRVREGKPIKIQGSLTEQARLRARIDEKVREAAVLRNGKQGMSRAQAEDHVAKAWGRAIVVKDRARMRREIAKKYSGTHLRDAIENVISSPAYQKRRT